MKDEPAERPDSTRPDTWYVMIVGALLVVIIAALSVLWLNERRARMDAEVRLSRLRGAGGSFQNVLDEMLKSRQFVEPPEEAAATQPHEQLRPVRREDLWAETVEFKGRPRTVLYVSAEAGRRFGFRDGDVVVVGEGPASRPATDRSGT